MVLARDPSGVRSVRTLALILVAVIALILLLMPDIRVWTVRSCHGVDTPVTDADARVHTARTRAWPRGGFNERHAASTRRSEPRSRDVEHCGP
jgi:hypothetical protein